MLSSAPAPALASAVEDWDLYEQLIEHAYGDNLRCGTEEHPIIVVEPTVRWGSGGDGGGAVARVVAGDCRAAGHCRAAVEPALESTTHHPAAPLPQWNTSAHREKMAELFFEKYNVPAFYLAKAPMLSRQARLRRGSEGPRAALRCHRAGVADLLSALLLLLPVAHAAALPTAAARRSSWTPAQSLRP